MNDKMALFLFEVAQKGSKLAGSPQPEGFEFGIFNPYNEWPKHTRVSKYPAGSSWNDKRFIREHGSNYRLMPEHSRPAAIGLLWQMVRPAVVSPRFWVGAATVGLVLYTGMNEPTRTDSSLNIPYRSISSRHHGN